MSETDTPAPGLSLDRLTEAYVNIRDARGELKRTFDVKDAELRETLADIGARLLSYCETNGVESARTQHGTFFRSVRTRYWATDWAAVHKYVMDNAMPELLEKRISQATMKQLTEDGVEVPGMNVDSEYAVTVRRK